MADEAVRTLREELTAAVDAAPQEPAPVEPVTPAPVEPVTPAPVEPVTPAPVEPEGQRRGPDGKFLPKEEAKPAEAKPAEAKPAEAKPAEVKLAEAKPVEAKPAEGPRAPASWRPALREKWGGMDPEVRAEITRREAEIRQALQESTDARDMAMRFIETVRPYEAFIRAENSNPFQAIRYMMDTAVALRTSPPAQKAQLVAGIVKQYGIDVQMLDQALVGQLQNNPAVPAVQQLLREELAPVRQFMSAHENMATARQTQLQTEAQSAVEQFAADPANEFYSDVEETMADLMEVAAHQGRAMTLKDAYNAACMTHPEVSKVMVARQMKQQAGEQQARADAARASARSIASSPAPVSVGLPDNASLRDSIEHSIEALSGR